MKLNHILKEQVIGEAIKYHTDNNMLLSESIFRMYSDNYFALYNQARKLYKEGKIENLDPMDIELLENTDIGEFGMYEGEKVPLDCPVDSEVITEAEYQGKKVQLNKPKRGGSKKFYVYVKDPKSGNIRKVSFGAKGGGGKLSVKLKDPKAKAAFASRHNCETTKDKTTASYWACRLPRYAKSLGMSGGGKWW